MAAGRPPGKPSLVASAQHSHAVPNGTEAGMRVIGVLAGRLVGGRRIALLVAHSLLLLGLTSAPLHAQPGSTAALKDSFGGTAIDSALWTTTKNLATATESGGTLNLTPNANTGAAYAFVSSAATYALTGSQVAVKAVTVPNNGNVDAQLSVQIDSNNYVKWVYQSGSMTAYYAVGGVRTTVATLT